MTELAAGNLSLSRLEETRLTVLELVIDQGRQTFIEVGNALLDIQVSQLYRIDYRTFEDYCLRRWDIKRQRAYELIEAAAVVSEISDNPPAVESHAAALAPLRSQPDALRDTWAEVQVRATAEERPVTAALVREVRDTRMGVHYSSSTDQWSTPQDLYDLLDSEFGFDLDVCATADNAKCERFYGEEDDGLAQQWHGVCWMNPPYGDVIRDWMRKAYESAKDGATVVCLVPARVDTGWWWEYARFGEVRFLRGRLKFGGGETGAPFPSAVVVFPRTPDVVWWERAA